MQTVFISKLENFYSRPCGRGDEVLREKTRWISVFLLTPLREGRLGADTSEADKGIISTHAPAGGATRRPL